MNSEEDPPQPIPDPSEPIDWKEAARLYVQEGLSYAAIARRLERHPHSIRLCLRRHGIPGRRRPSIADAPHRERLRGIWKRLRKSCRDPRDPTYRHYGARGLRLCAEWEKFESFYQWAIDSGFKQERSLALKERSRVFSPRNCRWIGRAEMFERRLRMAPPRPRRLVTAFGETKGAAAWSRDPRCKVTLDTLCFRLDRGVRPEEAIASSGRLIGGDPRSAARRDQRRKRALRRLAGLGGYWQRVIRLHVEKGLSCPEIARMVGRTSGAIRIGLLRRGLYRSGTRDYTTLKHSRQLLCAWHRMRGRCTNRNHREFKYYGGKGVRVAAVWRTFEPFHSWAIRSGYRPGLCMTRIERSGDFSPRNCVWVPAIEAILRADHPPRPRKPRWTVRAFGETKGPTAWSRDPRCAVSHTALFLRLRSGMPPRTAITLPPQREGGRRTVRTISAFGERRTLAEWSRDSRCRVTSECLGARLRRGIRPEAAIATPPFKLHVHKPLGRRRAARPPHPAPRG